MHDRFVNIFRPGFLRGFTDGRIDTHKVRDQFHARKRMLHDFLRDTGGTVGTHETRFHVRTSAVYDRVRSFDRIDIVLFGFMEKLLCHDVFGRCPGRRSALVRIDVRSGRTDRNEISQWSCDLRRHKRHRAVVSRLCLLSRRRGVLFLLVISNRAEINGLVSN